MNQVKDMSMDNLDALINLGSSSGTTVGNKKEKAVFKTTFLRLTDQVLVVNLINIPFMIKEMSFWYGTVTICNYILCSSFTLILMDNIGMFTNEYSLYDSIPNVIGKHLFLFFNLCVDILRLYFTSNHIIGYIKNFFFENTFGNTVIYTVFVSVLVFLNKTMANKFKYMGFVNALLALIITGYGFYTTVNKKQYEKQTDTDTTIFNYFQQLGILTLWLCPNVQINKALDVSHVQVHVWTAFLFKITIYLTTAIFGYIAFKNTGPIFVNNFESVWNPIIILFYLVAMIRVSGLVINVTTTVTNRFNNNEEPAAWLHSLLGFCIILPSAVLCAFAFMKTAALLVCVTAGLVIPSLTIIYYKPSNPVVKTMAVINLLVGSQLILMGILVYFI